MDELDEHNLESESMLAAVALAGGASTRHTGGDPLNLGWLRKVGV
jgi:hypothetical protein